MHLLRFLRHALRQLADYYRGPEKAAIRRLVRQGRATVGPHTMAYSLPRVKTFVHDRTGLHIGDYCSLSTEAMVMLGGKHAVDAVTTYPHRILWRMEGAGEDGFPMPTGDTVIGSDVWLCDGAIVLSGLRIGHGAIVAAGAVVTKDVPDFAVVAGNPAHVVKYRFDEEQRRALLEIAWWDWPEDQVRAAVPLLAGKDIDAFIAWARNRPAAAPQAGVASH
ncbi:MAG: CatB-related O-acetyltransferase [Marmoricola sp.]